MSMLVSPHASLVCFMIPLKKDTQPSTLMNLYILTIGWDVLHIKKHGGDLNPEEKDFGTGGRMPRRIHAAPAW